MIPASARDTTEGGDFRVWVYDPDEGTVSPREVTVGELSDDAVMLVAGVQPGESIAAAGVHLLRDGMRVKPLDNAL